MPSGDLGDDLLKRDLAMLELVAKELHSALLDAKGV